MLIETNVCVAHLDLPVAQRVRHQLLSECRHSSVELDQRSFLLIVIVGGQNSCIEGQLRLSVCSRVVVGGSIQGVRLRGWETGDSENSVLLSGGHLDPEIHRRAQPLPGI